MLLVLTPICYTLGIPYVIALLGGLLFGPAAAVPAGCGAIIYYVLNYMSQNTASLGTGEIESGATKVASLIDSLINNKAMFVCVLAMILTLLVVYFIRRLSVDHSWELAIGLGTIVNIVIHLIGALLPGINVPIVRLLLGSLASVLLAFVLKFFAFSVDYTRTERVQFEDDEYYYYVKAGAGVMLIKLAMLIAAKELEGFEYASGIPGTLGGAITMNAGAYGGEIKDNIISATVMNHKGEVFTLTKDELDFGYRKSIIQKEKYIVLEGVFRLRKGNTLEIKSKMDDFNGRRREKQPLEYPSAGSTFKRPEGYFAGKLIQDAGLSGYRVGGACVSPKHCGFVINDKDATSSDILQLMKDVDEKVYDTFGVHLEPEVRIL